MIGEDHTRQECRGFCEDHMYDLPERAVEVETLPHGVLLYVIDGDSQNVYLFHSVEGEGSEEP